MDERHSSSAAPRSRPVLLLFFLAYLLALAAAPRPHAVAADPQPAAQAQPLVSQFPAASWSFAAKAGLEATYSVEEDALRVTVPRPGINRFDVTLGSRSLYLEDGRQYTLRFRARADQQRSLNVVAQRDRDDFRLLGLDRTLRLTEEWQAFTLEFVAARTEPGHSRIEFRFAQAAGTVWLREIGLDPPVRENQSSLLLDQGRKAAGDNHLDQALSLYGQAVDQARTAGDRIGEAEGLRALGGLRFKQGQNKEALEVFEQALSLRRVLGDKRGEAAALRDLAETYNRMNLLPRAREYWEQAAALHRETGDKAGEGLNLGSLGSLYLRTGPLDKAVRCYQRELELSQELHNRREEALALRGLGMAYLRLDQVPQGKEFYERSLAVWRSLGDKRGEAETLSSLGSRLMDAGRNDEAQAPYEQALALWRALGDKQREAESLGGYGLLLHRLRQFPKALEIEEQALAVAQVLGDPKSLATAFGGVAMVYGDLGQWDKALAHHEQALAFARKAGDRRAEAQALRGLGIDVAGLGRAQEAAGYYEKAIATWHSLGAYQSDEVEVLRRLGDLYEDLGQRKQAVGSYERAIAVYRDAGDKFREAQQWEALGSFHRKIGQHQPRLKCYQQALALYQAAGQTKEVGSALRGIAWAYGYGSLGQPDRALQCFQESLVASRKASDRNGEGWSLQGVAGTLGGLGRWKEALSYYEQALEVWRTLRNKHGEADSLLQLARLYDRMGESEKSPDYYERAIEGFHEVGRDADEQTSLAGLRSVCRRLGQAQRAQKFLQNTLAKRRQAEDRRGEARVLLQLAFEAIDASEPGQAAARSRDARAIYQELKDPSALLDGQIEMGWRYRNASEFGRSRAVLEEALATARSLGYRKREAEVHHGLAWTYRDARQPRQAVEQFRLALRCSQEIGDDHSAADTLRFLGWTIRDYQDAGTLAEAERALLESRRLYHENREPLGESYAETDLATLYLRQDDPRRAVECMERAATLARSAENGYWLKSVLLDMGSMYDSRLSQPEKALTACLEALERARRLGSADAEVDAVSWLAAFYDRQGHPQRALDCLQQALPRAREARNSMAEARLLWGIGGFHERLGQFDATREAWERCRKLLQQQRDVEDEVVLLSGLGRMRARLGRPREGLAVLRQALARARQRKNAVLERFALADLACAYAACGERSGALRICREQAARARKERDPWSEASACRVLAEVYESLHEPWQAVAWYRRLLPLHRRMGDALQTLDTLDRMARLQEQVGDTRAAERTLRESVALLESRRAALGGLSNTQSGVLAANVQVYHRYLRLLLRHGKAADAFAALQKTKARLLLDRVYGSGDGAGLTHHSPTDREQELRGEEEALNAQMVAEGARNETGSRQRYLHLRRQLADTEGELRLQSDAANAMRPAVLRRPEAKTASLGEIGRCLSTDSALVEYVSLQSGRPGQDGAFDGAVLFCVTLRSGAPVVRAYPVHAPPRELAAAIQSLRGACADPRKRWEGTGARLYRWLIQPAAGQLQGKKTLIVCPDGPLWDVPFQALFDGREFLAEKYEIDYAYSATGAQAALAKARPHTPEGTLLALANPAFGAGRFGDNPEIPGQRPIDRPSRPIDQPSRQALALARDLLVPRGASLSELPGTQREAEALRRDFPGAAVFTREQAQEAVVKREAGKYRYLHFATHGFFNDAAPMLSSLVLAQPPKDSPEDGFLTARELFDLKLNAELVVLSACNTARGEKRSGEGIVGLTWALFAAGAPTQVVSQWSVDDQSTALLMERFYAGIKAGKAKGAALRAAELALLKESKYRHPYYWAPFVLMGDWR